MMMEAAQRLSVPSDSPDVTLAGYDTKTEQVTCKFHQKGHCKFGESCKHFHTKYTCPNSQCEDPSCTARHPRLCVYHTRFGHCRFGNDCSYRHQETSDVEKLKMDLEMVKNSLKTKENEIKKLEEKFILMEKSIEAMKTHNEIKTHSSEVSFKCSQCNYECASSTALKTHVTKKHKCENLRFSGPEEGSRRLSPEKDAPRVADLSPTSESTEGSHMENMCHICNKYFDETSAFQMHMYKMHMMQACAICNKLFDDHDFKHHNNEIFDGRACSWMV
jgi:hypothetical protein